MTTQSRTGNLATEQLTRALVTAAAAGQRPHCGDYGGRDFWLSEHQAVRAQAVTWCTGCPVLNPCRQAAEANDERFGVWGGRDFTPRPNLAGRASKTGAQA